jgi:hypothetical protein
VAAMLVWSVEALRDELALKARRHVLMGLEELGLEFDERLEHRLREETRLGADLLRRVSSFRDEQCLDGLIQGNDAWEEKLISSLSFGYSAAVSFGKLCNAAEKTFDGLGLAGALFNLAASLLDYLTDRLGLAVDLQHLLPESRMLDLLASSRAWQGLFDEPLAQQDEVALFLKVLRRFTHEARDVGDSEKWSSLQSLIVAAYRTQLASVDVASHRMGSDLVLDRSRKVFEVLATLASTIPGTTDVEHLVRVASRVGTVFGRLDDLLDVAEDLAGGHVNSVLPSEGLPDDLRGSLRCVLDSELINRHGNLFLNDVAEVVTDVQERFESRQSAREDFFRWLFARAIACTT